MPVMKIGKLPVFKITISYGCPVCGEAVVETQTSHDGTVEELQCDHCNSYFTLYNQGIKEGRKHDGS